MTKVEFTWRQYITSRPTLHAHQATNFSQKPQLLQSAAIKTSKDSVECHTNKKLQIKTIVVPNFPNLYPSSLGTKAAPAETREPPRSRKIGPLMKDESLAK